MASTIVSTTQYQIDVEDVIDNLIIQKDGSCSLVIKTNAINFGLLSEEEQDASIYTYAAFLNSLTFTVQILIRSDIKDISGYIRLLDEQEIKQANPIKRNQINQYKKFVASLISERNILEKSFYIIVPFSTLELGLSQSFTSAFLTKKKALPFEKSYIVEKAKASLEPRRDHILSQLGRVGLSAYQLNTQQLIQLLFSMYNASSAQGQKISNTQEYTVPLVQPAYIKPKEEVMDNQQQTPAPATPPAQPAPEPQATPDPTPPAVVPDINPNPAPVAPQPASPDPVQTPTPAPVTPPVQPAPEPQATPDPTPPGPSPEDISSITPPAAPESTQPTSQAPAAEGSSQPTPPTVNLDDAQQAINSAAGNLTGVGSVAEPGDKQT